MAVNYSVMEMTPLLARSLLANNTHNRTLSKKTVETYASAMRDGAWKFNGESIKVADNGQLLDGQHRLHAVLAYGKPVTMALLTGVPADAFDSLDLGKRRNAGDVLSTLDVPNANLIAAALRFVAAYDSGEFFAKYYKGPRATEIAGLLEQYPGIHNAAQDSNRIRHQMPVKMVPPSILCGLLYCCGRAAERRGNPPTDANDFFESVATGSDLSVNDPAYTLRERLLKTAMATTHTRAEHIAVLCVRAWNANAQGRTLRKLQLWDSNDRRTEFPVIY